MTFSEHLVKLRTERNISQKALAKTLNIGLHTYQRYEYGEREPLLSTLVALADFYRIGLDDLVCRERKNVNDGSVGSEGPAGGVGQTT